MIKILVIILIIFINITKTFSQDIYCFIKSKDLKQMNDVIDGFTSSFPDGKKVILDLEGEDDSEQVNKFISSTKPSVIISLGALAAKASIQFEKKIPIIFSMIINYKRHDFLKQDNVTGISMEIPAQSLFTQFKMLIPQIDSIGVPYHPITSSEIVSDAIKDSNKLNIKLVEIQVQNPNNIDNDLSGHISEYKGLWMIADTKLYNLKTKSLSKLIFFAKENKKPLLAFSEAFLKSGALFSISINYRGIGSQLALISRKLVQDKTPIKEIPISIPIGTYTVLNKDIAHALIGKNIDEATFDNVDKIYSQESEEKENDEL
ncbi:MAG: hypothetical protein HQK79_15090 [Desulfobacterales bacterium]|nr:hypothetical protein [Desulfobacterales bacterium]MBF0395714.1 hypothetical protein [Desulfobacterales bacterium]